MIIDKDDIIIDSEEAYQASLDRVDELWDAATDSDREELKALVDAIEVYEKKHFLISIADGESDEAVTDIVDSV